MNREELETITNNNLEIQELNKYIKKIQEAYKQLEKENLDLRRRMDDAVEIIESYNLGKYDYSVPPGGINDLLDILKKTNKRK